MMVVPSGAVSDPLMYSYNGVVLSAFPGYDELEYPYAHVIQPPNWLVDGLSGYDYGDSYKVVVTKEPVVYEYSTGAEGYHLDNAYGNYQYYREAWLKVDGTMVDNPEWEIVGTTDSIDGYTSGALCGVLVWSNYTVTSPDGLECPAASNPVPVVDDAPDGESILEVLNSLLDYDVATFNLLTYGTNRIRYIERYVASILEAITPSEEETAIRETFKDTSSAVVEEMSGGGFTVTRDDAKSFFESGRQVTSTLDTGTTVGDFFSVFSDYVFTGWFSEETRANLDSVNSVATLDVEDDDPYNHDAYEKNMEAFQEFLGRSEAVND